MNALILTGGNAPAITSRDIADLVNSRHDDVKRSIDRLVNQSVIESPPTAEIPTATRPAIVYVFAGERGKRDSIVVVAQLSPEFTARLVDRWQELEARAAAPALPDFTDPATAAIAWAEQYRAKAEAEAKLLELEPKAIALDRFANHEGQHNIRNAAKLLGIRERLLITWLIAHDWLYRDHGGRLCAKSGRLADGCMDTVSVEVRCSDGVQVVAQSMVTQKGLTRLAVLLARDGLIARQEQAA